MKDRTIKAKSPWMKMFTIGNPIPLDELAKSQIDAKLQIRYIYKKGRGSKRSIVQ